MENSPAPRPISQLSHEDLKGMRFEALNSGDWLTIQLIQKEARARDRWDDTDPRYSHMVDDCRKNILGLTEGSAGGTNG